MSLHSEEIRQRFLSFFEERKHKIIPSASLVPENDPSVLFTTAGMQPLVPYLLGEPHPYGKRLANYQRCLRTNDIEEVGDSTHLTFFEMLGNWSLGDYFKKEAIEWSYKLLTDKNEGFGLDPKRLYITVFAGNDDVEADEESVAIWEELGIPRSRIYYLEDNWWPNPREDSEGSGPCGPDTEMFYDLTEEGLGDMTKEEFEQADDNKDVVEIWNDVFMEYRKEKGKIIGKLEAKNVDTGSGLERITTVLQGKTSVYETDLFTPIIETIRSTRSIASDNGPNEQEEVEKAYRVIADHIRASVFIINDGIEPSNTDAGYILRRLLRRAIRYADMILLPEKSLGSVIADTVINKYKGVYTTLIDNSEKIKNTIESEEEKFRKTLSTGMRTLDDQLEKNEKLDGREAFKLFSTYGLPIEMIEEVANENGVEVDRKGFDQAYKEHQSTSKSGAAGKFKGGLAGSGSEMEIKYHTATHLLNAALRDVLGEHVSQRGSNITSERLRFDFSHPKKLTEEEKEYIEKKVNDAITKELPVSYEEIPLETAYESGAIGVFGESYPDVVKVYTIGDQEKGVFSKEICGGPHVTNTKDLGGVFRIKKEESVSEGVRRIKAVLD